MNVIKHENHTPAHVCISLHASKPSGTCTAGKTLCPCISNRIQNIDGSNRKMHQQKRNTKHLQNVQDVEYPHLLTYPSPLPHNPIALSNPPCDGSQKKMPGCRPALAYLVVDPKPPVFTAYPPVLKHDLLENPTFAEDFPIKPSICRGLSIAMLQHV